MEGECCTLSGGLYVGGLLSDVVDNSTVMDIISDGYTSASNRQMNLFVSVITLKFIVIFHF